MRELAKYRVNARGSLVTVKSRLSLGEKISGRELQFFEQQLFRGCFRPRMEGRKSVVYTAPEAIGILKYLKNPIEKEGFFEIIAQTLETVKRIELNGLYLSNLVLDLNLVFISERSHEVFFIYQPLISKFAYGNVYAFLESLVKNAKMQESDIPVLQEFGEYLANTGYYKTADIEDYIRRVCPQVYRKIVTANAGMSGFITNDRVTYAKHYQNDLDGDGGTTLLYEEEEETTILCGEEGTMVLMQEPGIPSLVRRKTEERVAVDKDYFVIGKEAACDFVVDNRAVSRRHAVIIRRGRDHYLLDADSTNGTFLNGVRLSEGEERQLQNQDEIMLADEVFAVEIL